ncbi:MAG: putative proline dehydrogenase/delta-1-pyrroline-5-carboxylate dehydraogenase, partial [Bacteroidetes bacterium]|nr:putative proline dehydrogenase/delta-1-pyrroline-5-carboxylate dehydraogenase [Bacteroidota bacterium]
VILYTPVVKDEHFLNAVSYLVRRLDENTGPENFLSYSFNLTPGSKSWTFLEKQFEEAYRMKDNITHAPTRTQDRNKPYVPVAPADEFINEPDTDFDLPQNQQWVEGIIRKWKKGKEEEPFILPLQIGAETVITEKRHVYLDRCQNDEVRICEMSQADTEQIKKIIAIADADPTGWRQTTLAKRHEIMYAAANHLAEMRGDLIGCMCAVTGKTVTEGDVEVSEGIDFARFYPTSMKAFEALENTSITPKGTILVISPWNFPCAIPIGGVSAALAGGNTVILKPATVAAPVAWMFAQAFWEAGVPKEALQVVIADREALKVLTTAPQIKHIILTGGTETALSIAKANPATPLSAETGGKNAIILTASGDRDHAIMNVVTSAFGNAGQKCSACSLLLVERSVYEDPSFKEKLIDAATSMQVGSVWNPGSVVGPMITNNNEKLLKAFTLESGEEWLVAPHFLDEKKYLLAPTIKWGVKPRSYSFSTELFGPMLSVVCIENLEEGIRLVNSLDYGLTSGLQSLDENEQALWRRRIEAGNLYINRGITGAIVNRQPFGGMKLSAFGGGQKAGGPNYCTSFVNIADKGAKDKFLDNYKEAFKKEFFPFKEMSKLYGEQNLFQYIPVDSVVLRLFPDDDADDATMFFQACELAGAMPTISVTPGDERIAQLKGSGLFVEEKSYEEFLDSMHLFERIRTCSPNIPMEMHERAAKIQKYIDTTKPVKEGRVELLHYLKEQSISFEYHRYGSVTEAPSCEI